MKGYFASFKDRASAEAAVTELQDRFGIMPNVRRLRGLRSISRDSTPSSGRAWRRGMFAAMAFGGATGAVFAIVIYGLVTGNFLTGTTFAVALLGLGAGALYTGAAGAISGSVLQEQKIRQLRDDQASGFTLMEIEVEDESPSDVEQVLERHAHLVAAP